MAKKNFKSELEGLHFDILNDFIENGKADELDGDMLVYLEQLKFIQQRMHRVESPKNVIHSLMAFYPGLNVITAKSRFDDALQFFYLDEDFSKQVWNNYLFEICMKAIQLAVRTVDSPEASLKIIDAVLKAKQVKGLDKDDDGDKVDPRLLLQKIEIHSLKPEDVGLVSANRQVLARQIDQLPLQEEQKLRLKMDAGVVPRELFNPMQQPDDEQTED